MSGRLCTEAVLAHVSVSLAHTPVFAHLNEAPDSRLGSATGYMVLDKIVPDQDLILRRWGNVSNSKAFRALSFMVSMNGCHLP